MKKNTMTNLFCEVMSTGTSGTFVCNIANLLQENYSSYSETFNSSNAFFVMLAIYKYQ